MLSSLKKKIFGKEEEQQQDEIIRRLNWGDKDPALQSLGLNFMEFPEFPDTGPGDSKKHTLLILVDPEESERGEVKGESKEDLQLLNRNHWMPDRLCKVCYACEEPFTYLRRRHHCRFCGQIFCNTCSSYFIEGRVLNQQGQLRACKSCFDHQMKSLMRERRPKLGAKEKSMMIGDLNGRESKLMSPSKLIRSNTTADMYADNRSIFRPSAADGNQFHAQAVFEDPDSRQAYINSLYERSQVHISSVIRHIGNTLLPSDGSCNKELWLSTIIDLVQEVVAHVDPNVRQGDSVDIRNYVNIEIIPGGPMSDSQYVDGVVFQKNVAHKKMMDNLAVKSNPQIMILSGGVDFLRSDAKLASMDTLIEQEEKYMEILVEKIMSQKPSVLLVGKSVARRAQDILKDRQVVVMQNVKEEILQRVSRMTGATILSSTEQIIQQDDYKIVGSCESFQMKIIVDDPELLHKQATKRILETRIAKGSTYAYFRGCPADKGCTILLRGASRGFLQEVKKIINFAIVVAYHLRLEIHFYIDKCSFLPAIRSDQSLEIENASAKNESSRSNEDSDDESKDYIEKNNVTSSILLNRSERVLLSTSLDVDVGLPYYHEIIGIDPILAPINAKLSPFEHQTLLVAHVVLDLSNKGDIIKSKSAPEIKGMRFYSEVDVALGQYLVEHCFHMQKSNWLMHDHCLSYIHRNGRIDIKVSQKDKEKDKDKETAAAIEDLSDSKNAHLMQPIYMSSYCKECEKIVTPDVIMSDETWKMSFGKFMEILFYNKRARCRTGNCPHSTRDYHILRFACDKYLAEVDFIPVHPFKMVVSKTLTFPELFHFKKSLQFIFSFPPVITLFLDKFKTALKDLKRDASSVADTFNSFSAISKDFHLTFSKIDSVETEIENTMDFSLGNIVAALNSLPESLKKAGNVSNDLTIDAFNVDAILAASDSLSVTEIENTHAKLKYPLWCKREFFQLSSSWNAKIMSIVREMDKINQETTNAKVDASMSILGSMEGSNAPLYGTDGLNVNIDDNISNPNDYGRTSSLSASTSALPTTTAANISSSAEVDMTRHQSESSDQFDHSRGLSIMSQRYPLRPNISNTISGSTAKANDTNTMNVAKTLKSMVLGSNTEESLYIVDLTELGSSHWNLPCGANGETLPLEDFEPGTIIAYSLSSSDYQKAIEDFEQSGGDDFAEDDEFENNAGALPAALDSQAISTAAGGDGGAAGNKGIFQKTIRTPSKIRSELLDEIEGGEDEILDDENVIPGSSGLRKGKVNRRITARFGSNKNIDDFQAAKIDEDTSSTLDASSGESKSGGGKQGNDSDLGDSESQTAYTLGASVEFDSSLKQKAELTSRMAALKTKLLGQNLCQFDHTFDHSDFFQGTTKYGVTTYYATQFEAMRNICLNNDTNEQFARSLSLSQSWLTEGGKSGASFFKTSDNLFIVKLINKYELNSFLQIGPAYFEYMSKVFFDSLPSVLSKILGIYSIVIQNREKKISQSMRSYIVMENVFYEHNIDRTFDLKGSARQRYTEIIGPKPETIDVAITRRRHERRNNMPPSEAPVCHQTLLDDNLMETTNGRPIALRFQSRRYFNAAVTNDTTFLAMVDVVDYSILVGINDDNHSMIVGIIDYLRKYDILKRLERGGKLVANLVAGQAESTIIPPKDYQKRFTAAMDRYFTIVPDKWNKNKIDKN